MRRKFCEIAKARDSPLAQEALARIGALYAIETDIRGQPPDQRRAVRQARAGPLLADLHDWLAATLRTLSRKAALAEAIRYTLTLWPALTRYRDDGCVEIDNNAAERAARCFSLIGTATLNGLDPEAYLRYVLERIAEYPVNRVAELLPWHVATHLCPAPVRAAVASDDHILYAALVRRDGETLTQLLDRLDAALAKAFEHDDYTDEING